jgi:hypothetical protein
MGRLDDEIEETTQAILSELKTKDSWDLSESAYARKALLLCDLDHTNGLLLEMRNAPPAEKTGIEKKAIVKTLLYSTWLQRLYFVIRSVMMGLIGAVITLSVVAFLGSANVYEVCALGALSYVLSLVISRLFDAQVMRFTKGIVRYLAGHERMRDFVMDHV